MSGVWFCLAALFSTYNAGKRSLVSGVICLVAWGYFYGIVRANVASTAGHFIFDSAVIGLYGAQLLKRRAQAVTRRRRELKQWIAFLIAWSLVLFLLPFQPALVTLVGLRGTIFFLPLLLLAARLTDTDLLHLSCSISILNVIVLFIAVTEFTLGLERFYPHNSLTTLIYSMRDAGGGSYRIPATFSSPAGYGGTMVSSLGLLFGGWTQSSLSRYRRIATVSGLAAAFVGVLLCACRYPFIEACLITGYAMFTARIGARRRMIYCLVIILALGVALSSERLQRFTTLRDTDYVETRIHGSVNRHFGEILLEYPMGNGLGGGGTPMPYFVEDQIRNPIAIENEFARIAAEQGIVGLLLWIGFLVWVFASSMAFVRCSWREGRRIAWFGCLVSVSTAFIGVGLFVGVPPVLFLLMGWFSVEPRTTPGMGYCFPLRRSSTVALYLPSSDVSVSSIAGGR